MAKMSLLRSTTTLAMTALSIIAFAGCGGGGGGSSINSATGITLSGTVADGVAMANTKVTIQSSDGETAFVGTTDANGKFADATIPETIKYPALLTVSRSDDSGDLKTIIPSNPGNGAQTANINPITQAITAQVLPTGKTLADMDVGSGSGGFAAQSKTAVETIFGTAVT